MSVDNEAKFIHLSFEEYIADSKKDFEEIKKLNTSLVKNDRSFENDIRMIKEAYANRSLEDTGKDQKIAFGTRIKEFFLKLWKMICVIFERISALVVNLIKSIIIFLKKKKLQSNLIFQKVESAGGVKAYNFRNDDIIGKAFAKNPTVKVLASPKKANACLGHDYVIGRLNSKMLKSFMSVKVNADNPKSMYDFEILKQRLVDLNKTKTADKLKILSGLEVAVKSWYARAVFFNEPEPSAGQTAFAEATYERDTIANFLLTRNVDALAQYLVLGQSNPKYLNAPLRAYFGLTGYNPAIDITKLAIYFEEYYNTSQLVIGNGGYIEQLERVLKTYNAAAKRDAKTIKSMRDSIIAAITGIANMDDSTAKETGKSYDFYNRLTNVVQQIKLMKTHFIRLRQTALIDIINLYSMENTAWSILTGNWKKVDPNDAIMNDEKIDLDDNTIIKRPGAQYSQPEDEAPVFIAS